MKTSIHDLAFPCNAHIVSNIYRIKTKYPDIIVTIDTTRSEVASACLDAGIDMINIIMPLRYCENLVRIVAKRKCPVALIYNPQNITNQPKPFVAIPDAIREIQSNLSFALGNGIDKNNIIIDPGIGFGKNDDDNFLSLKQLTSFKYFNTISKYIMIEEVVQENISYDSYTIVQIIIIIVMKVLLTYGLNTINIKLRTISISLIINNIFTKSNSSSYPINRSK
mgnify:CR=1 FL=1